MNPYIGITDFISGGQVEYMLTVFKKHVAKNSKRKLHIGVMMSYKTLHDLPSRYHKAFPRKEEIAGIFSSKDTYNCLHYANFRGEEQLSQSLTKAVVYGGSNIHAIQLDMTWPDPLEIQKMVKIYSKPIEIILQIGKDAFAAIQEDPNALVERLKAYDGIIHRVLLDKSVGSGTLMNAEELLLFANAIYSRFPALELVAAGGLGPGTVYRITPLLEKFPGISMDAQRRLKASGDALDPMDIDLAEKYLMEATMLTNLYSHN